MFQVHVVFTKIGHMLGRKTSLNRLNPIEFMQCMLPDHNRIKTEINNNRTRKAPSTWRLNIIHKPKKKSKGRI